MALDKGTGTRKLTKPPARHPIARQARRDQSIRRRQGRIAAVTRLIDESIAGVRPAGDISADIAQLGLSPEEAREAREISQGRGKAAERQRMRKLEQLPGALGFLELGKLAPGGTPASEFSPGYGLLEAASIFPFVRTGRAAGQVARHVPRTLRLGEHVQQLPSARSPITRHLIEEPADALSRALPNVPLVGSASRVAKHGGRAQAREGRRAEARISRHVRALRGASAEEQLAHRWWAQLPGRLRNATGLRLVRGKLDEELQHIASGRAAQEIVEQQNQVQAAMRTVQGNARFDLMERMEELRVLASDLNQRAEDIGSMIARFDRIIAKTPKLNPRYITALKGLSEARETTLVGEGVLDTARAAERKGLIARWLDAEPTGGEIYLGHRLPTSGQGGHSALPTRVAVGKPTTPRGVGSENKLVLAKTGRIDETFESVVRDWRAAEAFKAQNRARREVGAMGVPFKGGRVPEDHLLVNPKGRAIPAAWRQFSEVNIEDAEQLERAASEISRLAFARTGADIEAMKRAALEAGIKWDELRVVPEKTVNRYFGQFTPAARAGKVAGGYDYLVDLTAASIVFARLGYIPKNIVQNVVMAVPHQGPLLLRNAVRAGQLRRDEEIWDLLMGEVGFSGATRALGKEAKTKKAVDRMIGFVGSVADDPMRATAFLHEASAAKVIGRGPGLLTRADRRKLLDLFNDPAKRPLLDDISSRATEAMADFTRMTPTQRKYARRLLIIPGWLMAGSRYPFHFAATHPARSALLAYIAMGEPGAPEALQLNPPITQFFEGKDWRQGIATPIGRLRTGSINPVTTPWEIGTSLVQSARGKEGPFDYASTAFDYAQPVGGAIIDISQGEGVARSLKRLAPNVDLIADMISPEVSPIYPEDATRLGRLKREVGVVPIQVDDPGTGGGTSRRQGSKSIRRQGGGRSKSLRRR